MCYKKNLTSHTAHDSKKHRTCIIYSGSHPNGFYINSKGYLMAPVKMVPEWWLLMLLLSPKMPDRLNEQTCKQNSTMYLTPENVHKQSPKQYKKQKMNFQT